MTLHAGYAASRISSTLKGSTKQFGWLQASATTMYFAFNHFRLPATIRIDKHEPFGPGGIANDVSIVGSAAALLQCSRQRDDPATDMRPVESSEAKQQTFPGTASQSEAVKS